MGIWPNSAGMMINDPWVVPYQNCLDTSDWLHKYVPGSKYRFSKCNLSKESSCQNLYVWFGTSSSGSLIRGSTVTIDLFLRWAIQGPLGPLVILYWSEPLYVSVESYFLSGLLLFFLLEFIFEHLVTSALCLLCYIHSNFVLFLKRCWVGHSGTMWSCLCRRRSRLTACT